MKILIQSFLILIVALTSCTKQIDDINTNSLMGRWVRSMEEETDDNLYVFRPHDFKEFAPSRFRFFMVLKLNNECDYFVCHPTDMHYVEQGFWDLNQLNNIIFLYDNEMKKFAEYEIISFDHNKLIVRPI